MQRLTPLGRQTVVCLILIYRRDPILRNTNKGGYMEG